MEIKTKAGQKIEFRQRIDDFGWDLWILTGKKIIRLSLTDEEVKWLELDLRKRLEKK